MLTAFSRARIPSRWRACKAAWRLCEFSLRDASSSGVSLMIVRVGWVILKVAVGLLLQISCGLVPEDFGAR